MEERIMNIAVKLSEIRLQLYRIQAEGDNHSSSIAKKTEKILDECVELLDKE